jgi:hypothetical protein
MFKRFSKEFMEESILQTNKFFGGLKPEVSNVISIQGETSFSKIISTFICLYQMINRRVGPPKNFKSKRKLEFECTSYYNVRYERCFDYVSMNNNCIFVPAQSFSRDLGPTVEQMEPIIIATQKKAKEYILKWISEVRSSSFA